MHDVENVQNSQMLVLFVEAKCCVIFIEASEKVCILQSNLYITATFGTTKTWLLYTCGHYTETL